MSLRGQVALVTGGSRGLGRAIAGALAEEGCRLAIAGREAGSLDRAAQELRRGGGEVHAFRADVTREEEVKSLFRRLEGTLGAPDILVNNVGAFLMAPVAEMSFADWNSLIAANLHSAFLCSREALPAMLKRGSGRIINIGSGGSLEGAAGAAAYCAAKFGLRGFTLSLAEEVRERGVAVSLVMAVGTIETERTRLEGRGGRPETWIDPRDIARAVVFLASQGPRCLITEVAIRPPRPVYG